MPVNIAISTVQFLDIPANVLKVDSLASASVWKVRQVV